MTGFEEKTLSGVTLMTAKNIAARHGFTTRLGGVSEGIYASLNLGENRGDEREAVSENYRRLRAALEIGDGRLVFSRQVHLDEVRCVTVADAREPYDPFLYEADGLVTDEKGLGLIIFTADCVPVLLYDGARGVAAAVHAGWRGTALDIAGKAVLKMTEVYGCRPENINAAIGPCISGCCFETNEDVPNAMRDTLGTDAGRFITQNGEKFTVDLKGINRALLMRAGVPQENISVCDDCTMCSHEKYWSHRYTKGERGSQAAVIVL